MSIKLLHFPMLPSNHTNVGSDRQMIIFTGEEFCGLVDMPEGMGLDCTAIQGTHLHGTEYSETFPHIRDWQSSPF
jgi:hypothetical protein